MTRAHLPPHLSKRAVSIHVVGPLHLALLLRAVFGNLMPGNAPGNGPHHRMMAGIMPRHGTSRATGNTANRLGLAGAESRKANPYRRGEGEEFQCHKAIRILEGATL